MTGLSIVLNVIYKNKQTNKLLMLYQEKNKEIKTIKSWIVVNENIIIPC